MPSFHAIKKGGRGKDLILQKGKSNHKNVYNGYSYPFYSLEKDHKHKCLQFAEEIVIINPEGVGARTRKYQQRHIHSNFTRQAPSHDSESSLG